MGACYAFRRSWYLDIETPLYNVLGWGWEEEVLSIMTHIYGGEVRLLSQVVGHIYDAPPRDKRMSEDMKAMYAGMSRYVRALVDNYDCKEGLLKNGIIKQWEK